MVKIMENPIKMDDLGVPIFLETPICFFLKDDTLLGTGSPSPPSRYFFESMIFLLKKVGYGF